MNACMFTWCRPVHCSWCQPRDPISAVRWRASRGNRPRGVRSNPHYPDDSHHTLYSPDSTKPPPTASRGETEDERLLWCSEEWNSLNTIKERRERERQAESRQFRPELIIDVWGIRGFKDESCPKPAVHFLYETPETALCMWVCVWVCKKQQCRSDFIGEGNVNDVCPCETGCHNDGVGHNFSIFSGILVPRYMSRSLTREAFQHQPKLKIT